MKFWFCEKCGKRITEADFPPGLDPEKVSGQVVCKACAVPLPVPPPNTTSKTRITRISGPGHPPVHAAHATSGAHKQAPPPAPAPPSSAGKANLILGVIALIVVGVVVFLMMSLNSGAHKSDQLASASATNTNTGASTTSSSATPANATAVPAGTSPTQTQTAVEPQPAPLNRVDPEAAASDAFFVMNKKLPTLKPSEQAAALDDFITKFPDSSVAARANRMLKAIREAEADATPISKPDVPPPAVQKPSEPSVPATPPEAPAPPTPPPAPVSPPAPAAPAPAAPALKIEPVKIDESLVALTTFQLDFFAALASRQLDRAATLLSAAQKEPQLASRQAQLTPLAPALDWLKELDAAPAKGAALLKDIDSFTLPVAHGEPLRIGRSAPFKLESFKDGVLTLSNQGLSLPVPLSSLPDESRTKLAVLALGNGGHARVVRAAADLLVGDKQIDAAITSTRAVLQREEKNPKASAPAPELACLQQLLAIAESGSRERAAAAAWKEIQNVEVTAANAPQCKTAVENFQSTYGNTLFGIKTVSELQVRATLINEMLSGILAYWKFDETEGATAADNSGHNYNAILVNGPQWVAGKYGNAISLNGTDQYIQLPEKLFFAHTTCSLSVWFKTTTGGMILGYQTAPVTKPQANFVPVLFVDTNGHLRGNHWIGHEALMRSATTCNDGKWHCAALCAKDNTQTLYLDGAECGTVKGKIDFLNMLCVQLGVGYAANWPDANSGWYYFKGELDDVRLYDHMLTANDVRQIFEK